MVLIFSFSCNFSNLFPSFLFVCLFSFDFHYLSFHENTNKHKNNEAQMRSFEPTKLSDK